MKTAIIHYWLVSMRGGEKMLEALLEIFPQADIYTHVINPREVSSVINSKRIFTSQINKLPFAKKLYQLYLPLMPDALLDFDLSGYDLIISSEAGPAKGVVANPGAFHVCYCHSPMRYVWDMYHDYLKNANPFVRFFMKRFVPKIRLWDVTSSNLVDRFITNSGYVAKRIKRIYNREAEVVYGPASIEAYINTERNPADYYLYFGQITCYKKADIAIEACIKSGRKIVVAGGGADKKLIKKYSNNSLAVFKGRVSQDEACSLFSRARALLFPGIEDLGLVPIEAQAAGCPVIAYRGGGALETIKENITGVFFDEQTPQSLIAAIDNFEKNFIVQSREVFNDHVKIFSKAAFIERVQKVISDRKSL